MYDYWKLDNRREHLIEYVLPTEDLEDLNLIRKNYLEIENYDFKKIIEKYFIENSIIAVFFKNGDEIKVLSKIKVKNKQVIKSNSFNDIDLNKTDNLNTLIYNLKLIYEDFWKENNLINTSIKLPITISIDSSKFSLIKKFENKIENMDLVYNYYIESFSNNEVIYKIVYNGTPNKFLEEFNTENIKVHLNNNVWKINEN